MPPKCPAMLPSFAKKTRKSLTLEVKLDIIHRHERGGKTNSIAHHHFDSIYCLYYFLVHNLRSCKLHTHQLVTITLISNWLGITPYEAGGSDCGTLARLEWAGSKPLPVFAPLQPLPSSSPITPSGRYVIMLSECPSIML
ncbi:hypothetical protein E2C01_006938 [Portunus trituberculatus]|uniref:Uncharacterized protein n=1 Tax=Portunus trituberculatus TaxID=210409 RepID=A0A5B7CZ59_PORTR|nr:hypothetical protein [Portunus trituberculatus]